MLGPRSVRRRRRAPRHPTTTAAASRADRVASSRGHREQFVGSMRRVVRRSGRRGSASVADGQRRVEGFAERCDQATGHCAGPGERHLLTDHCTRSPSAPGRHSPTHVGPASETTSAAERRMLGERRRQPSGSASRSSSRRSRCTAVARSAHDGEPEPRPRRDRRGLAAKRRRARSGGRAPDGSLAVPRLEARGSHVRRGTPSTRRRRRVGASADEARSRRRRRVRSGSVERRGRERSSVGLEANTSRTVSLNWRTLPKPAANAMSVNVIDVVSISSRAVWARCARAIASGPAPSSSVITRFR